MTTNITSLHQEQFAALRDPSYDNFALFSCFVNGKPSTAIVAITSEGEDFLVQPLFVAVTPDMVLRDHEDQEPV